MDKTLLEKYAKLTILIGAGLKKGQEVILNTSVECNEFNRELVKQCYQYGAKNIHIEYRDDYINKLNYQNQSLQILTNIPKYIADRREIPVKNGACIINVISDIPDIFKDINSDKLKKISQAKEKALKVYREYQSANRIQ
jgi:aminopeptidase